LKDPLLDDEEKDDIEADIRRLKKRKNMGFGNGQ
jgi:hypothetical protein